MQSENTIKIIITDDHALFSDGLKRLIEIEPDMVVVGNAADLKSMWYVLAKNRADILLLDLNLGKDDGLEAVQKINLYYPKLKIIILTTYNLTKQIPILKKQGVKGYLKKNSSTDILLKAIRVVSEGQSFFEENTVSNEDTNRYEQKDSFFKKHQLTERETAIISLIAKGYSSKAIGQQLHISEFTVKAHRRNIKSKLKLSSNSEIVQFAMKVGLVNT